MSLMDVDLVRWTVGGSRRFMVVSTATFNFADHWCNGRTMLCPGADCPRCKSEDAVERSAFFCRFSGAKELRFATVPRKAFEACDRTIPAKCSGVVLNMKREKRKWTCVMEKQVSVESFQPSPFDAMYLVAKLNRFPSPAEHESPNDYWTRCESIAREKLKQMQPELFTVEEGDF